MNYWQMAWRNLMQRKRRTFLTILSIIIGVASIFAVNIAVDSAEKTFPLYLKAAFGKTDFTLNGSNPYISEDVYKDLQDLKGMQSIAALKENTTLYLNQSGITPMQKRVTLVSYSRLDSPITNFKLIKGDLSSEGAVITDRTAKAWKKDVGDTIALNTDSGIKQIKITAIVKYTVELMGPSSWMMANYHPWSIAVPLDVVQKWYHLQDKIDSVQIKANNPTRLKWVEAQLDQLIKHHKGVYLQPVVIDFDSKLKVLNSFFSALYIAGCLGIVLSAFIIFNSLYVSIKERKREFAVLRTIGYTSSQIQGMVLLEVVLLSLLGTAIGLVIGYGFGIGLKALIFLLSSVYDEGSLALSKGFIISVLVGLLVPILASLWPIYKAGKFSVIQELNNNQSTIKLKRWLAPIGLLLIIAGCFIKNLVLIVPLMVGIVLVFPYLFRLLDRPLKWIYRKTFGFSGEMAHVNLNRNRNRASMTSVILCLGIAMIVLMSSLNSSLMQTYASMIYSTYGGNLDVMLHHIEKDDLQKLNHIKGVASATSYSMQSVIWSDHDHKRKLPVYGIGEEWIDQFPLFTTNGPKPSELIKKLGKNDIVLDRVSYEIWGGKVGDTIWLDTLTGPRQFKVASVVDTMKNSGYGAFLKESSFNENFGPNEKNILVIKNKNTSSLDLRKRIFAHFGNRMDEMYGPEDWVTVIGVIYTGSFTIINGLVVLAILVSGIGISNTLLISILERIREIGMMRAVGVSRRQIIGMILLEGLGMGVIATIVGALFGVLLIYLTSRFMEINTLTIHFNLSWVVLLFAVLFGIATSLIASLPPASRAAKTKLGEALRYE